MFVKNISFILYIWHFFCIIEYKKVIEIGVMKDWKILEMKFYRDRI